MKIDNTIDLELFLEEVALGIKAFNHQCMEIRNIAIDNSKGNEVKIHFVTANGKAFNMCTVNGGVDGDYVRISVANIVNNTVQFITVGDGDELSVVSEKITSAIVNALKYASDHILLHETTYDRVH